MNNPFLHYKFLQAICVADLFTSSFYDYRLIYFLHFIKAFWSKKYKLGTYKMVRFMALSQKAENKGRGHI